ncbi:hypothetical protein J7T55_007592 [Diaporthe amygdali]|uniref:uncharacterized protein n=1 Tax=Phomopsis amygdali TaxID=1214568 RepID=UPI0022FDFB99|nr:uncharacterized protein J7T55_007592 [Diaporthe amygdali]KAJ0107222.1 hypothetical protein J7T55_007592 [Diaporthe amygdali]
MSTTALPTLPDPNDGLGAYGLPSTILNLENELEEGLKAMGSDYMLAPYHEWTIVEDRKALDAAPTGEVRLRFREWSEARSVERDGPGADHELIGQAGLVARFEACIMVDKECLDSMEKNKGKSNWSEPYFMVIGLDRLAPPPRPPTEEDLEELREIGDEDILEEDGGNDETWMLASCQSYVELYNDLFKSSLRATTT